jgi:tetratricopeptide (TPR) repeat protein
VVDSPPLWYSLELDPGTSDYFHLPRRVYVPVGADSPFLETEARHASLEGLAHALERAAGEKPEMAADVDIQRFLRVWPRYADLERYLAVDNATFARAVARAVLDEDPQAAPALAALGVLAAREGDWTEAERLSGEALEVAPAHAPTRLQHALALAGAGRRDEALEELERLVRHPRVQAVARLWRHEIRSAPAEALPERLRAASDAFAESSEEAGSGMRAWRALAATFPENPEVLFTRALRPGEATDDGERETLLRRALAADPDHVPAAVALATLLRRTGRPEEAERFLVERLTARPRNPLLLAARGQALEQLDRREEALAAYRAVFDGPLSLVPPAAFAAAGPGLFRLAPPEATARLLKDAVEARPGDPLPHEMLARLDELREGRERAERRLRDGIRACGPLPVLEYALGDLLRRSGRRVEAEGLFKVLAKRHPRSPLGHRGLGDLAVEEQPAEALEHYRRALTIDPWLPLPGHDYLRGVAALRGGEAASARRWLERAVAAEPDNPRYWCDLGAALFYMGDLDRALAATERARSLRPEHPGFLHNLAVYHRERFRRHPITGWRSGWASRRLARASRRALRRAGPEAMKRDLWQGPQAEDGPAAKGEPPPVS